MENIELKSLSLEQLKALAYDLLVSIENSQKNLQVVNQEIVARANEPTDTKDKN